MKLSVHRRAGMCPLTMNRATARRATTTPAQIWHALRIVRWSRHAVRNLVLLMILRHVPISACPKMSRLPPSPPRSSCYPMSSTLPALPFLLMLLIPLIPLILMTPLIQ